MPQDPIYDDSPGYWAVIPAPVLYDPKLRPNAKLLYGVISGLVRARGYCWATNARLAAATGLAADTVSGLVAALVKRGYVRIDVDPFAHNNDGADGKRKIYLAFGAQAPSGDTARGVSAKQPIPGIGQTAEGVSAKQPTPLNNVDSKYILKSPIAPKDKKQSIAPEVRAALEDYAGQDAALLTALLGFAEMRARKKGDKAIRTLRTVALLTAKLDDYSGGRRRWKLALLDEATEKGWLSPVDPAGRDSFRAPRDGAKIRDGEDVQEWTG